MNPNELAFSMFSPDGLGEVGEQLLETRRELGKAFIDAYEQMVDMIAGLQEQVARETQVDWPAITAEQQAKLTRDIGERQVALLRALLT